MGFSERVYEGICARMRGFLPGWQLVGMAVVLLVVLSVVVVVLVSRMNVRALGWVNC